MDPLHPFVKLPEYPFVICKECHYACIANEVQTHLRKHHCEMEKKTRSRIIYEVKSIPGIIRSQDKLRQYSVPEYVDKPIPIIAKPKTDGIQCQLCSYITRQEQGMRDHCRHVHGWKNDWKQADNFKKKSQEGRVVPWTTNIRCQRLFPSRAGSGWFEVGGGRSIESPKANQDSEIMNRVRQFHNRQEQRFKEAEKEAVIEEVDQKLEANAWLGRVGWSTHLDKLDPERLRAMTGPAGDEEGVLRQICESLDRAMESARGVCRASKVGLSALFEINRREVGKKPAQPFDARMEEDSWMRYKDVWRKIICVWYRTQQQDEETRPPYQFTSTQQATWDKFVQNAQVRDGIFQGMSSGAPGTILSDGSFDCQCLEVVMAFLDHQIPDGDYQNAIISALAVLGIREDGGWHDPSDYTPVLSAVVKVARMFAISWAYQQREADVKTTMRERNMEERLARESVPGMFPRVRRMVRRFMTRVGDGRTAQPGPMDWILETRTYGMHIRFNTTAGGSIDWNKDQVQYKRVRFDMGQLAEMMFAVVGEARGLLAELAMVGEDEISKLPAIPWERFEDDNSEDQVGYSFLRDRRNAWLNEGKGWAIRQIAESKALQKEWISHDEDRSHPYRMKAVQDHSGKVERFGEKLWLLVHIVSGQPARTTEILSIRHQNTSNGGARNIFISKGQVCFVTAYHKNFRQTNQAKIIHRFMPRAVGELLVWYLWLVLPFWQEVQGMIKGANKPSAFMWGEEMASVSQTTRDEGYSSDKEEGSEIRIEHSASVQSEDDEGVEIPGEWKNWIRERKWTSDGVRRILQQHSERLMGCKLNISIWRHVAIAISNRYLGSKYRRNIGEDGTEYEDEDGIDDEASDLQAGHGSHVAGMIYARELQQGLSGTALAREKFREVSTKWHRFFGFDMHDTAQPGHKRKREGFESAREEVRFQRLHQLQQVNISGQLQQMMGQGTEFRGQQSSVIRAIIAGDTPIVQITSTGGGKSLSFMLPAYCSPEGTTIVIVPLVALQDDLLDRCRKLKITSHIWKSRQGNPVASIVFVTAESAVTAGFGDFVGRLQSRGMLDRVVVDECHTLLDGSGEFRPKLSEVGQAIRRWGVQRVFLTATLGPDEMDEFYKVAAISPTQSIVFRSKTKRPKIQYKVIKVKGTYEDQEDEENSKVWEIVQEWLEQKQEGKAIIYTGSVDRVKKIGEMLGCGTYYNGVDTAKGKKERLKTWIQGERVIVATNALGMGIDVANVRLVVHAWMPRRMRDYVQESGRAGRDGQVSQAVVICGGMHKDSKADKQQRQAQQGRRNKAKEREENTVDYVEKDQCRRITLDRCMDGRTDGEDCEDGEEKCDVCSRYRFSDTAEARSSADNRAYNEAQAIFERQKREVRFEEWQDIQRAMQEAATADELEGHLEDWGGCCVVCRMGDEPDRHKIEDCPHNKTAGHRQVMESMGRMEREVFGKRRLANYSGCFGCGLPYKVCNGWRPVVGDEGRYVQIRGGQCQHKGVLVRFYGAALKIFKEKMEMASGKETETAEFYDWAGSRIAKWGGMETNEMCRGFVTICRWIADD